MQIDATCECHDMNDMEKKTRVVVRRLTFIESSSLFVFFIQSGAINSGDGNSSTYNIKVSHEDDNRRSNGNIAKESHL